MFELHTCLTETCVDLIRRIKNIKTSDINITNYREARVKALQSNFARALLDNQNIESLQLRCDYDKFKVLADELIDARRPILTDLHLLDCLGVVSSF